MFVPIAPLDRDNPDKEALRRSGRRVRRRLEANRKVQRIAVEEAELWAMAGVFDTVECGRLIAMIDAQALPSKIGGGEYASGLRTSTTTELDPRDPFVSSLAQRIDDLLGIDSDRAEPMQGQRYLAGQEFKPHVDWFTPRTPAWEHHHKYGGQRTYTAMVFLNRVEAGGETDFPTLGIAIEPRPGTLLAWNNADENGVPNPATLHAGNPVSRGAKYIVTKWYRCGRWL